jgi:hypothetical protein
MLEHAGTIKAIGRENIFETVRAAVATASSSPSLPSEP